MGLYIGFSIYKKKKGEDGKITLTKQEFPKEHKDDVWCCGRCEVNYSWGYGYSCTCLEEGGFLITKPTFDEELDGYVLEPGEKGTAAYSPITLKYVPFEKFKNNVSNAIEEVEEEVLKSKRGLCRQIKDKTKTIAELRSLQKDCTKENAFAFNKWTKEINQLKEAISELNDMLDNYDTDDYDATHAKQVKSMLEYLEKYQEDGYVCIPYYSN